MAETAHRTVNIAHVIEPEDGYDCSRRHCVTAVLVSGSFSLQHMSSRLEIGLVGLVGWLRRKVLRICRNVDLLEPGEASQHRCNARQGSLKIWRVVRVQDREMGFEHTSGRVDDQHEQDPASHPWLSVCLLRLVWFECP